MTQDERWTIRYNEVMDSMEKNHRRPSKYNMEERNNWNWMRHLQKLIGKGEMKVERIELFEEFLLLVEQYKRKNQYQ